MRASICFHNYPVGISTIERHATINHTDSPIKRPPQSPLPQSSSTTAIPCMTVERPYHARESDTLPVQMLFGLVQLRHIFVQKVTLRSDYAVSDGKKSRRELWTALPIIIKYVQRTLNALIYLVAEIGIVKSYLAVNCPLYVRGGNVVNEIGRIRIRDEIRAANLSPTCVGAGFDLILSKTSRIFDLIRGNGNYTNY